MVVCTLGPWLVLWLLGDRRQFRRAVGSGILFALIASYLDDAGVSAGLWWYPEQPVPAMMGNALWNIVAAVAVATLVVVKALARPHQTWFWVIGMSLASAGVEWFLLVATDLLAYPGWSPLLSIPCYILLYWIIIWYTRWVWRPPHRWEPPKV
jgi:hypothetical protein